MSHLQKEDLLADGEKKMMKKKIYMFTKENISFDTPTFNQRKQRSQTRMVPSLTFGKDMLKRKMEKKRSQERKAP